MQGGAPVVGGASTVVEQVKDGEGKTEGSPGKYAQLQLLRKEEEG